VTAERYTVVFTGLFSIKKPGEYPYLSLSGDWVADGDTPLRRGRPPYGRMGREIMFEDLPGGCRQTVLDVYRNLWGLLDSEGAA
jgi:hypothetical protein